MVEREQQIYGVATFDDLYRAREETLELRRRGLVAAASEGADRCIANHQSPDLGNGRIP
jgi:hypothetical protein